MRRDRFRDPGLARSVRHRALHDLLVEVMPAHHAVQQR
jgi:hypothetical protein